MKIKLFLAVVAVAALSLMGCKDEPVRLSSFEFEHLSFAADKATIEVDQTTSPISIAAVFTLLQQAGNTDTGTGVVKYGVDKENSTAVEGTHYKNMHLSRKSESDQNIYFAEIIGGSITEPVTLTLILTDVSKYPNPSKKPVIDKITITLTPKK